jgi:hypothetical protein
MTLDRNIQWTISGRRIDLRRPRPEDICIEDIAHALARQCRFAGHVLEHYSVAQHSMIVSVLCDPVDALWGLLHDAAEAYISDLPYPVKSFRGIAAPYQALETRVQHAICRKFGLPAGMPASVHAADKQLAYAEMYDLMPNLPSEVRSEVRLGFFAFCSAERPTIRLSADRAKAAFLAFCSAGWPTIRPLSADKAEAAFLARFSKLTRASSAVAVHSNSGGSSP